MSATIVQPESYSVPGVVYLLIAAQIVVVLYAAIYYAYLPERPPRVKLILTVLPPCLGANISSLFYGSCCADPPKEIQMD